MPDPDGIKDQIIKNKSEMFLAQSDPARANTGKYMSKLSTNAAAVIWVTLSTLLFSFVFASGKFVGGAVSPIQILFFRYVGGLVTLSIVVMCLKPSLQHYRSKRAASHFMRAIFGSYGGVAAIYAAANMPLVDATAIGLLQGVFVIVLGVLILKEHISPRQMIGIVLCSTGAFWIVASKGAFQDFDAVYLLPATIALLGAVLIAMEGILIKTLTQSDTSMTVLLHVNTFGVVLLGVPTFMVWEPVDWTLNGAFFLIGPLAILAQYLTIRGYRMADVALVGPVDFTWLIFAALIGVVFFNEIPSTATIMGSIVILVGGVVLAMVRSKSP
jgi:drug/metabolite transporter (DMT)-like permease